MVQIIPLSTHSGIHRESTAEGPRPILGEFYLRKNSSSHPQVWRDRGTMDVRLKAHGAKSIKDWHPLFYFYYIESKKFLRDRAKPPIQLGIRKW
jgi:hypothetical protein